MNETVIDVRDFRKAYRGVVAVDGVSFEVRRGEILSLLGPNGAGKTTTLECLEGLRAPDSGILRVMGIDPTRDPRALTRTIGVQLQVSGLPESIRVDEAMRLFCAYHGVAPRYDLLERLGLKEKARSQYHALSTGLQRRLALALALAHDPPVIFLDEPTAGLDVASRVELHDLMREIQRRGTTFVLATHDMAEVEKLADRVAILLRGRIVATGTPRELTAAGGGMTRVSVRTERSSLNLPGFVSPAVTRQTSVDGYALFYTADPGPTVAAMLAYVAAQGDTLVDLRVERPSLEERFLELTGTAVTAAGGVS